MAVLLTADWSAIGAASAAEMIGLTAKAAAIRIERKRRTSGLLQPLKIIGLKQQTGGRSSLRMRPLFVAYIAVFVLLGEARPQILFGVLASLA